MRKRRRESSLVCVQLPLSGSSSGVGLRAPLLYPIRVDLTSQSKPVGLANGLSSTWVNVRLNRVTFLITARVHTFMDLHNRSFSLRCLSMLTTLRDQYIKFRTLAAHLFTAASYRHNAFQYMQSFHRDPYVNTPILRHAS